MRNKKAQSISINMIVVAAIALIVLIVLIFIFQSKMGEFRGKAETCSSQGGVCLPECGNLGPEIQAKGCDTALNKKCCIRLTPS